MQISAFLGSEALRDYSSARFNLSLAAAGRQACRSVEVLLGTVLGFGILHGVYSRRQSAVVSCILNSRSDI